MNNVKDYQIKNEKVIGVVSVYHNRLLYSNKEVKKFTEDILNRLEILRLKIDGLANRRAIHDENLLQCTSCYHSIKRDGLRYCGLFNKFVDPTVGNFCVYHSQKLKSTSSDTAKKMQTFMTQTGELDTEKILSILSKNPKFFSNGFFSDLENRLNLKNDAEVIIG